MQQKRRGFGLPRTQAHVGKRLLQQGAVQLKVRSAQGAEHVPARSGYEPVGVRGFPVRQVVPDGEYGL